MQILYVIWCCSGICQDFFTFIQIGSGHTVFRDVLDILLVPALLDDIFAYQTQKSSGVLIFIPNFLLHSMLTLEFYKYSN
jgi:hypothetical protein